MSRKKKNKNVSDNILNGIIVHTRDEYFEGQGTFRKEGYEKKGNYRMATVVDSNKKDDLALVKLYGHGKGFLLSNKRSKIKGYVETLDDRGQPIRISGKFVPDKKKKVSKEDLIFIKQKCFENPKNSKRKKSNKTKVRKMK